MKVDLKAEKTEAGWIKANDKFFRKATPQWFQLLGWVIILGVISYIGEQTQNVSLRIASGISYYLMFFYLQSVFYSVEIHGIPFVKSERVRRNASLIISGIVSLVVTLFLYNLIWDIQGKL